MYQNVSERFLELLNEPSRQFKYKLEFSTYTISEDVKSIRFYGGSNPAREHDFRLCGSHNGKKRQTDRRP